MPTGSTCMIKNCRKSKKDDPELSLFHLPKRKDVAEKWIQFAGHRNVDLSKNYVICSDHFLSEQYKCIHPRKLLSSRSVPCINGPKANENDFEDCDPQGEEPNEATNRENEIIFEYCGDPQVEEPNEATNRENEIIFEYFGGKAPVELPTNSKMEEMKQVHFEDTQMPIDGIPSTSPRNMQDQPIRKNRVQRNEKPSLRNQKLIMGYKEKINSLRCKMKRMKKKQLIFGVTPTISSNKSKMIRLINESKGYLTKEAYTILKNEFSCNGINKKNRRYDDDIQQMCLLWYYASPRGYNAISRYLSLPTPRTLRNWQSHIKISPGINQHVVESLKLYFSKNTDQKKNICCLMFDEISLREELHFDRSKGKVVGVVDIGRLRTNAKATTALVCMARGIAFNWKYALGYWFVGHSSTNEHLHSIVLDSVDCAQQAGLKVKAIICDQSPVNQSLARKLEISSEKCFFSRNGEKIFFIFDVPHLLKSIRNNLAKYDMVYSGNLVSWKYIKSAFDSSNPLRVKLMHKITSEHFNVTSFNAMKVKYAAQIFSETVSITMLMLMQFGELPAESKFTAEFVEDMDKVFDCLNSNKLEKDLRKMRYAMSSDSPHGEFLINFIEKLKKTFFRCQRRIPPCISGFIISINSTLQLAEELRNNNNIPKLLTRHLNQDPLENFFSTVRQQHGCCRNPSPQQFENGLRHNYISSIYKLCSNSNCEKDSTFSLGKLKQFTEIVGKVQNEEIYNFNFELKDIDNVHVDLKEENAIFYVSGYMAKKFIKTHDCEICRNILVEKEKHLTGEHQMFTYFKQGEAIDPEKGLLFATEELFKYIQKLEIIHNEYFPELLCSKNNIIKELVEIVKKHDIGFTLCSSESSDNFLNLFMTIRCHWGVRFINDEKKKRVTTKNQKLKNICHE